MAIEFIHSLDVAGDLDVEGKFSVKSGGDSTQWDTAYAWGNHADAGYTKGTNFVLTLSDGETPDYFTPSSRRVNPNNKNPTNEHYAISTFGNGGNVTGQLATHFQSGLLYSRGYNSSWSTWKKYHNTGDFTVAEVSKGVTAYGWGDHALAGYAKSSGVETELDPVYTNERDDLRFNKMVHSTLLFDKLEDYNKPSGYSTMIQPSSYQNPLPSHGYYHVLGRRDGQGGYGALLQAYNTHQLFHGVTTENTRDISWYNVWNSGDFAKQDVTEGATAHTWGNHADAGYAASSHNHDGRYLRTYARLRDNLSSIDQSGVYVWDVSDANDEPTGASDGLLTVKYWDSSSWATASFQDFHNRKLYITSKKNGTWLSDWAEVHTTDSFSAVDVAQGVAAYEWGNHADAGYTGDQTLPTDFVSAKSGGAFGGDISAPSFIGKLMGGSTGAPDAIIWCVSGQYTDWGIFYDEGNPDKILFKSSGNTKASIALDNGNINTSGTVTASGGNSGNWNTAYGWGNHADAGYTGDQTLPTDFVSAKSGGTFGGSLDVNGTASDISFVGGSMNFKDSNNYIRITKASASAQLGLFREGNGGMYIGASAAGFRLYTEGFAEKLLVDQSGNATFAGTISASGYNNSNWNTAYGWGNHASAGYLTRVTPVAPAVSSKIVGETIEVIITASKTTSIDNYLVFSSIGGGDYGLISVIPPEDFSATMSIIDNTFDAGGKTEYRVYAVKQGVYSAATATSQTFTVGTLEPLDMSVVSLNTAHFIQWNPPASKQRFIKKYNVYHHEHDTESSLARSSASLIYTGLNTSFMRQETNTKFHQFWVEIETV